MSKEKIEGIIGIIEDGIKDSCMQMDWAEKAKQEGDTASAALFESEAQKRLMSAKEWLDKNKEFLKAKENSEKVALKFVEQTEKKLNEAFGRMAKK